jgi:ABC-type lipoprotein release transport system permease subunit
VTGVAIIGALNFDMLLLSRGLLVSFADMLNSAGFDVRIIGGAGPLTARTPLDGATGLADQLRRLPEIEQVVLIKLEPATLTGAAGRAQDVTLVGASGASLRGAWTVIRGTDLREDDPSASGPALMVARPLADQLSVVPGSIVRLRLRMPRGRSALPAVTCTVAGIADFSFESASDSSVAMTMEGFRLVQGGSSVDDADVVLVRSNPNAGPDAAVRTIATLRPDLRVYSNEQVISEFNRNGFTYFRQISVVLSTTTVVFAFLLVATLLTVSVNQRLGEVAALRAIGMGRFRIATTLLWESALMVGLGGVASLPLGGVLAIQLDRILRRMPGLPERLHFFVFEPRALVVHLAVLAMTALVAAFYPVWIATHLSIAGTLRREVIS